MKVPARVLALMALVACSGVTAVQAGPRAAWAAGAFAEAWETAHGSGDAAMQLLAAEAAIAHALHVAPEGELRVWLDRAGDAADRALESADALRPVDLQRALLLKAHVRGEVARRSGALSNLNVANEVLDLLQRAHQVDPDAPAVQVALGMWHVEVAARGVGWLFGANGRDGLALVERAVAAAPDQIEFRIEYATALHLRDRVEEARAQLDAALSLPLRDAIDRHLQARAAALLSALE